MSLLGWVVGAMVLDEFGRQQDEIDNHDRALRERDRKIDDLEARLSRIEGNGGLHGRMGGRYGSQNRCRTIQNLKSSVVMENF